MCQTLCYTSGGKLIWLHFHYQLLVPMNLYKLLLLYASGQLINILYSVNISMWDKQWQQSEDPDWEVKKEESNLVQLVVNLEKEK